MTKGGGEGEEMSDDEKRIAGVFTTQNAAANSVSKRKYLTTLACITTTTATMGQQH